MTETLNIGSIIARNYDGALFLVIDIEDSRVSAGINYVTALTLFGKKHFYHILQDLSKESTFRKVL